MALWLAGCSSDEDRSADPQLVTYRLTASQDNPDSRASVDETTVAGSSSILRWDAGDQIDIWSGSSADDLRRYTFTTEKGGLRSADFIYKGSPITHSTYYLGFYPSQKTNDRSFTLQMPTDGTICQPLADDSRHVGAYRPMYAAAVQRPSDDPDHLEGISFHHMSSLLVIRLVNDGATPAAYRMVTLSTVEKSPVFADRCQYTLGEAAPTIESYNCASAALTLGSTDAGIEVGAGGTLLCFLPILPSASLQGLTLQIEVMTAEGARLSGRFRREQSDAVGSFKAGKYYTMGIRSDRLEVIDTDLAVWEDGGSVEIRPEITKPALPTLSGAVDGVRLSEERNTLYFAHTTTSATLLFEEIGELECRSDNPHIVVTRESDPDSRAVGQNRFRITVPERDQNAPRETGTLEIRLKGMLNPINRIDVVLEEHSNRFYRDEAFTDKILFETLPEYYLCDYNRYVDGTLGYLEVPAGSRCTWEGRAVSWIRLDAEAGGDGSVDRYRIEGGWKPNDPDADGRDQETTLVITPPATASVAAQTERYLFRRKNCGLPVVEINGVWWCKYNLAGNSTSFSDQISIAEDRNIGSLETFITNYAYYDEGTRTYIPCGAKEQELYYRMLGDGYQAGNATGMKYRAASVLSSMYNYADYAFYYPWEDTNMLAADALTPDGYKLPEDEDFRRLAGGDRLECGYTDSSEPHDYTVQGINMKVEAYRMPDMAFNQQQYSFMTNTKYAGGTLNAGGNAGEYIIYIFTQEGRSESLVMMGHPYQYGRENNSQWESLRPIAKQQILFACHTNSMDSWFFKSELPGGLTWYTTRLERIAVDNLRNYTKTLRCVKKPVKYIMD